MNPVALYLASGESLYVGAGILLVLIGILPWVGARWWRRAWTLGVWVAVAMMVMACPPFPGWFDGLAGGVFVAWLLVSGTRRAQLRMWRGGLAPVLAFLVIVTMVLEWPRRILRPVTGVPADHLVVMGDSISAGIAGDDSRWPMVFARQTGEPVKNLSQPGAQVADVLDWTKKLGPTDTLVLLEIGGNDLIAGTPTAAFDRQLEALLKGCVGPGRRVVMFELPLLPHRVGYGASQRRLAAKYDVVLIPKRCLVQVLRAGTLDGLHLSPEGAKAMAGLVQRVFVSVLADRHAGR